MSLKRQEILRFLELESIKEKIYILVYISDFGELGMFDTRNISRVSLLYPVLLAIGLGVVAGLFFGPYCRVFQPIGKIFFMLLQMVLLPYIPFLLMHGLGSLNGEIAKKLLSRGWVFLLLIWGMGFAVVYSMIYLIPPLVTAFIEKNAIGQEEFVSHFLSFVIPQNFFYDLANNVVPAVAVFGLIAGLAIMMLEKKEPVLVLLSRINDAMEKILVWLAIASPLPIFAHVAVTVGTVDFQNLAKVEFYIVTFILGALFYTFVLLPILWTSLTNFTWGEVMREFRIVCLIPFATAMPSLAFPFLYYALKRLARRYDLESSSFENTGQTVMPLAFTFSQIGNFFILFFVFFLSFYTRHPILGAQEYFLPFLTLPMSFGTAYSSVTAVSFLISQLKFQPDSFSLFEQTSVATMNFQVLLSVASLYTLIVLVLSAYYGVLKVQWKKLILGLSGAFIVLIGCIVVIKPMIYLEDNFTDLYVGLSMPESLKKDVEVKIYREGETVPPVRESDKRDEPLSRILNSGVLRVGYHAINIPFCFFNKEGELVGYDVAFAYQLAKDLDCDLEFIPLDYETLGEDLQSGKYDIAMSAIIMNENRLRYMDFVSPYIEQNNVLVVPSAKQEEFLDYRSIEQRKGLRIGAIGAYEEVVARRFPNATYVSLDDPGQFTEKKCDALLWGYLSAFVWCLQNPNYTVIDYDFTLGKKLYSYPVRSGADDWLNFMQSWILLKNQSGFAKEQYLYWIEGLEIEQKPPRWCIIRDVLHWIN
ncbi:MAG: cation:dicarboxylase symporter family transporter [Verrucomicrobia bacterium]|nr:cation:dicarboxylase symporter family transporter [Verrucomicrobiota bacterium]